MRTTEELVALVEGGVKKALAMGAEGAEVYASEDRTTTVAASGRNALPTENERLVIGVRLVSSGRTGLSGASTPAGIERAIVEALRSVGDLSGKSDVLSFPSPTPDLLPRVRIDPRLAAERVEGPTAFVEEIVSTALSDPRVTYVDAKVASHSFRLAVANSTGLAAHDEGAWERSDLEVRCSRGTTHRSGREGAMTGVPIETEIEAAAFAHDLIERVGSALEAVPLRGHAVQEAVFFPGPTSQIVSMISKAFHARETTTRAGSITGELGDSIYAPCITLMDEPRGPAGVRRRNVDDEGVPTRTTRLVDAGRFVGLLHDARSAARAGVPPTGNGIRLTASGSVDPGSINFAMAPGDSTIGDLIGSATRAIIVNDVLLGSFTHNAATGDFSVVVPYAFLVENGRIVHALPPTTIGGNAHRVLKEARAVGRERKACAQGTVPALLTGGVSCAT
ncbi:MAG: TldD/PmbA family protein [Candidatus Thermoplasmatota archaeon]